MANSSPYDGSVWLTGAPTSDQPHGNDYLEHQATKKALEIVNNKEHVAIAASQPVNSNNGGEHKNGSAVTYHGDYSNASAGDSLPNVKPDGISPLDSNDAGRIAYDTDATYGGKYYRYSGSAWVEIPYTEDTETNVKAKSWVIDEDTLVTNTDEKVPTQQSVKAYVDNNIPKSLTGLNDSNGETKIGELEIKWGTSARTGSTTPVTFLGAGLSNFSNYCFQVVSTNNDSKLDDSATAIDSITQAGFNFYSATTVAGGIRWIAIGR